MGEAVEKRCATEQVEAECSRLAKKGTALSRRPPAATVAAQPTAAPAAVAAETRPLGAAAVVGGAGSSNAHAVATGDGGADHAAGSSGNGNSDDEGDDCIVAETANAKPLHLLPLATNFRVLPELWLLHS